MVQQFLGTLQLPMAIYMLDYYLPMLSPNEGHNETGLTMQSAGPVREPELSTDPAWEAHHFGLNWIDSLLPVLQRFLVKSSSN